MDTIMDVSTLSANGSGVRGPMGLDDVSEPLTFSLGELVGQDVNGCTYGVVDEVPGASGTTTYRVHCQCESRAYRDAGQLSIFAAELTPEVVAFRARALGEMLTEAVSARKAYEREFERVSAEARSESRALLSEAEAHQAFRDKVRALAIRVASEQGWCNDGLNDALDDLGLPVVVRRMIATVTVTVQASVTGIHDPEEAARWIQDDLTISCGDSDVSFGELEVTVEDMRESTDSD